MKNIKGKLANAFHKAMPTLVGASMGMSGVAMGTSIAVTAGAIAFPPLLVYFPAVAAAATIGGIVGHKKIPKVEKPKL